MISSAFLPSFPTPVRSPFRRSTSSVPYHPSRKLGRRCHSLASNLNTGTSSDSLLPNARSWGNLSMMTRIPCGSQEVDCTHTCHNDVLQQRFKIATSINAFQIPASMPASRRLDHGLFHSRANTFRTIHTIYACPSCLHTIKIHSRSSNLSPTPALRTPIICQSQPLSVSADNPKEGPDLHPA
ncbi:hypothetical protein WG66_008313 [Moniliophthora roreri]|nr:hypothetical protein WG66_008313 [Moniliophthora roreri]